MKEGTNSRRAAHVGARFALATGVAVVSLAAHSEAAVAPPGADAGNRRAEFVPVLLVPGWGDDASVLEHMRERLRVAGWETTQLLTVSFEDPVGCNRDHAKEIARAVLELKDAADALQVDLIAHSVGGLATRYFLLNGGHEHVRRVVFLATPQNGTVSAYLAWGQGAREMEPGSAFLLGLKRGRPLPGKVRGVGIRTPLDLNVLPPESAALAGLPKLQVCCPTHMGLLHHDETFQLIERFLRDEQ